MKVWNADFVLSTFMLISRKTFLDDDLENTLWEATRATTTTKLKVAMKKMKSSNDKSWEHMFQLHPSKWSRSTYSTHTKCHLQVNNMCKAFNKAILEFQDKSIIQLIEELRHYLTDKIIRNRKG